MFDKLSILTELRYFFVKILTHYTTDLKHAVTMPSHQGYCLTCIHSCISFIVKIGGVLSYCGLKKVLFHVTKAWRYLNKVFNS